MYYVALPDTSKNKADYICFITDKEDFNWVKAQYEKRLEDRGFFKQVKTNGFNLETMNFVDLDKIKVLIAVGLFSLCAVLVAGLLEHEKRPIKKFFIRRQENDSYPCLIFAMGYAIGKLKSKP